MQLGRAARWAAVLLILAGGVAAAQEPDPTDTQTEVLIEGQPDLPPGEQPAPHCEPGQVPAFTRFIPLAALVPEALGEPIACEHVDVNSGDVVQETTTGAARYLLDVSVLTFTNGPEHWAITGDGLVYWTGSSPYPPGIIPPTATPQPPTPTPIPPTATPTPPPPAGPPSEADVAARVLPSVVRIRTSRGTGTGVRVSEGILTNHHVVGADGTVEITLQDGSTSSANVIRIDPSRDLALLTTAAHLPMLELAPARQQRQGETVLLVGYPLNLSGQATVTRGGLSAIRDEGGVEYVQTDAAANPGNSGGPLVNLRGQVIGILEGGRTDAEGINFAIATESVLEFLAGARAIPPTALPTPTPRPRQSPISFSGTSDFDSASFALVGGPYRVEWSANHNLRFTDLCYLGVGLGYTASDDGYVIVDQYYPSSGGTHRGDRLLSSLPAGSYYVVVRTIGCNWTVRIVQE